MRIEPNSPLLSKLYTELLLIDKTLAACFGVNKIGTSINSFLLGCLTLRENSPMGGFYCLSMRLETSP